MSLITLRRYQAGPSLASVAVDFDAGVDISEVYLNLGDNVIAIPSSDRVSAFLPRPWSASKHVMVLFMSYASWFSVSTAAEARIAESVYVCPQCRGEVATDWEDRRSRIGGSQGRLWHVGRDGDLRSGGEGDPAGTEADQSGTWDDSQVNDLDITFTTE